MTPEEAAALGSYLRQARNAKGLSARQLGELSDMNDASIVRIENGTFKAPRAEKLARIAEALDLNTFDVMERAGYTTASDLPEMQPYLRTKYRNLPPEAMEQIERYASRVAKKHGISLEGPAPGEDEA